MLSLTDAELAMIRKTARERGEQPAVLCRTIALTASKFSRASAGYGAYPLARPKGLGRTRAHGGLTRTVGGGEDLGRAGGHIGDDQ
jgi:hypothetical protein